MNEATKLGTKSILTLRSTRNMKTVQPTYENIKLLLKEERMLFIRVGKNTGKVQTCYKNPKGIFVRSSLGEHKIDLFSELYVE